MHRINQGVTFVSKLPTQNGYTPVRFTPINDEIVFYWDNTIQPFIKIDKNRTVDKNWVWPRLFRWQNFIARALGQSLVSIAVGIEDNKCDTFLPIGLILLVKKYYALHDTNKQASFVWFMSTAPKTFLSNMLGNQNVPEKIGSAMLDTAISLSFNSSLMGRIGLHAAPPGGQWLFDWYLNEGLKNLDKNKKLPSGRGIIQFFKQPLSGNDGRYFYTDQQAALAKSRHLDIFR